MRPWMVATVGLSIALLAIYALVTGVFEGGDHGDPSEEIDSRSREKLRDLLQDADEKATP